MSQPKRIEITDTGNQVPRSVYLENEGAGLGITFPGFRTKTGAESDAVVLIEFREGIPHVLVWSDRTQEDYTDIIPLEKAAYGVRCPLEPRDHDLPGCGSFNTGEPDEEGLWDCECGIWFNHEEADFSAVTPDDD